MSKVDFCLPPPTRMARPAASEVSRAAFFYRIAGELEQVVKQAREKGRCWLRGRSGSRRLYQGLYQDQRVAA